MGQAGRRRMLAAACALLVAPPFAMAQRPARDAANPARIGVLMSSSRKATEHFRKALYEGLAESGWTEGRNLVIDIRYADGRPERHEPLARELLTLDPEVIIAPVLPGVRAVRKLSATVPVVFVIVGDPVATGLAQSLARPGGRTTGISDLSFNLVEKRFSLLRETVSSGSRFAMLFDPRTDTSAGIGRSIAAETARKLGVTLEPIELGGPETFDAVFDELARIRPDGVLVFATPRTFIHRAEIVRRMNAVGIPAMYSLAGFVTAGGLMSYAADLPELFRLSAAYVDRILRGAAPGELPIRQATKFQFLINLTTARALKVSIPQSLLLLADQVIE